MPHIGGAKSGIKQKKSLKETKATGSAELMAVEKLREKSQLLDFLFIIAVTALLVLGYFVLERRCLGITMFIAAMTICRQIITVITSCNRTFICRRKKKSPIPTMKAICARERCMSPFSTDS